MRSSKRGWIWASMGFKGLNIFKLCQFVGEDVSSLFKSHFLVDHVPNLALSLILDDIDVNRLTNTPIQYHTALQVRVFKSLSG
jgi:hypothetical protein